MISPTSRGRKLRELRRAEVGVITLARPYLPGSSGQAPRRRGCGYTTGTEQRRKTTNYASKRVLSERYFILVIGTCWLRAAFRSARRREDKRSPVQIRAPRLKKTSGSTGRLIPKSLDGVRSEECRRRAVPQARGLPAECEPSTGRLRACRCPNEMRASRQGDRRDCSDGADESCHNDIPFPQTLQIAPPSVVRTHLSRWWPAGCFASREAAKRPPAVI
jgi:hypothetical protein